MNEDTTARYTLEEARREFARRECANHGHSWNVIQSVGGGPMRIVCESCGWSGAVEMGERP